MRTTTGVPIRRILTDDVYEGIRELLFDENFAPGKRLVIDHLAARLGVSPTPVREALARGGSNRRQGSP
jgi:DNA-binding GntR family transcriptional regulator